MYIGIGLYQKALFLISEKLKNLFAELVKEIGIVWFWKISILL